ncbi:MAG: hypothetical protein ACLRM9_04365 [Collinsella aerofaciens]
MDYDGAEALLVRAGAVEYSVLGRGCCGCRASRERLSAVLVQETARSSTSRHFLVAANELAELRRRIRRARGSVGTTRPRFALY